MDRHTQRVATELMAELAVNMHMAVENDKKKRLNFIKGDLSAPSEPKQKPPKKNSKKKKRGW